MVYIKPNALCEVDRSGQAVLNELTIQQHLHPHRPLGCTLRTVCERRGIANTATTGVLCTLGLSEKTAMGRLSRQQITSVADQVGLLDSMSHTTDALATATEVAA
jgi:hypothetical protein